MNWIIKAIDPRQCGQVMPIRQSVASGIIVEHICVEPRGHDGLHRDKAGNVWVNQEWLLRQRGIR